MSVASMKDKHCAVLFVWNIYRHRFMYIPCDIPMLDKATLYCSKPRENVTASHSSVYNKALQRNKYSPNIFTCTDGTLLPAHMLCDNKDDCLHGSDEKLCSCHKQTGYEKNVLCRIPVLSNNTLSPAIVHDKVTNNLVSNRSFFSNLANSVVGKPAFTDRVLGCFSAEINCLYTKDKWGRMMHCPNGSHLATCDFHNCTYTFKCPGYYCVPWNYVCDGDWDCPWGLDEKQCVTQSKPGYFRCSNSSIFIHPVSICDNTSDCPMHDDEMLCTLHGMKCIKGCNCIIYALSCEMTDTVNMLNLKTFPIEIMFLSTSKVALISAFISKFKKLSVLIIQNSTSTSICLRQGGNHCSLRYLNLMRNELHSLGTKCFSMCNELEFLSLPGNKIKSLPCNIFFGLHQIKSIDLSENLLSSLYRCSFSQISYLKLLKVVGNPISFIDYSLRELYTSYIETDNFQLCCIIPSTNCTTKPEWPFSCGRLLKPLTVRILSWIIPGLGCIINVTLFLLQFCNASKMSEVKKAHSAILKFLTFSHLCYFVVLFTLSIMDEVYSNKYISFIWHWMQSPGCHFVGLFSFYSALRTYPDIVK